MYREKFSLYESEIELARCFFTKEKPRNCVENPANSRTSNDYMPLLTVYDFTSAYCYPSSHVGVYPLDTNCEGILTQKHGYYEIECSSYPRSVNARPADDLPRDRQ